MTHPTSLLSLNRAAWDAVSAEREFIALEARRYASFYPEASDGRNTFIMFAEMIEGRNVPAPVEPVAHDNLHEFVPNKKYPWFCAHCGYAPHEPLKHIQPALDAVSATGEA